MHSYVTSKNVKWCHLIWPTLYTNQRALNYYARPAYHTLSYSERKTPT